MKTASGLLLMALLTVSCRHNTNTRSVSAAGDTTRFPDELTQFVAYGSNPVFKATGTDTWDQKIRERGYILAEDGVYYLWYTGYNGDESVEKHLGLATSADGLTWTRYKDNPIYSKGWVEDMCVVKHDGTYYMFAEGRGDTAHMLTSKDRIRWEEQGRLSIHYKDGSPLKKGAYGTPAVWYENGLWYLFYEREDTGIWLATSDDLREWTNVQDDPVIAMGPGQYDRYAVAMDQIIKYKGRYYGYYHATEFKDWKEWNSCVAVSEDLVHWTKFWNNPIMKEDKSSPVVIFDGSRFRLYTMHPAVCVHFQK